MIIHETTTKDSLSSYMNKEEREKYYLLHAKILIVFVEMIMNNYEFAKRVDLIGRIKNVIPNFNPNEYKTSYDIVLNPHNDYLKNLNYDLEKDYTTVSPIPTYNQITAMTFKNLLEIIKCTAKDDYYDMQTQKGMSLEYYQQLVYDKLNKKMNDKNDKK